MNNVFTTEPVDLNVTPAIEFKNVSFRYASQADLNLHDLSFAIYPGEKVLIIGPSGSGKSTIGKMINGQIPNTFDGDFTGDIFINGQSIKGQSIFDLSLQVGTVLQDTDGQFVGLTVAEDLAFALENDYVDQGEMVNKVNAWATTLDLHDLLNAKPQALSGGQKQRVSIGGVLIDESPIALFDEPLANQDPASGLATMALIGQLNASEQLTTIVIEHRLEETLIADIDRVIVIEDGHLVGDMSVDALLRSDLLDQIGVRQPLYLDAFAYAGVSLDQFQHLGAFTPDLVTPKVAQELTTWYDSQVETSQDVQQTAIVQLDDVAFRYQDAPLISDMHLTIYDGELISLVGTNGAGKSTLAKLLCGFERPDAGTITLFGQDAANLSIKEIADNIGYVMQNPNLMISKNILADEVAAGLINRGLYQYATDEALQERVGHALTICGLYPYRNWPISALSYGQKRRATIASILVLNPKLLILDEPTAGQDYKHYTDMMTFIQELNATEGITILMITHDMHLMQEYSNRTIVLHDGKILADDKPSAVLSNEYLMKQAHLAPTSIYQLAKTLPNIAPTNFIDTFIRFERNLPAVNPTTAGIERSVTDYG